MDRPRLDRAVDRCPLCGAELVWYPEVPPRSRKLRADTNIAPVHPPVTQATECRCGARWRAPIAARPRRGQ